MLPPLRDRPTGPTGPQVSCSGCGAVLDALRAGHVAILGARFHYFCNYAVCRSRFLGLPIAPLDASPPPPRPVGTPMLVAAVSGADATEPVGLRVPAQAPGNSPGELIEPLPSYLSEPAAVARAERAERRDVGMLLIALTLIAGALAMALEFASPSRLVLVARAVLLAVGTAAFVGQVLTGRRDATDPHPAVVSAPPVLATVVAAWAFAARSGDGLGRATFLGGAVLVVAAVGYALVAWLRRSIGSGRDAVAELLDVPARRPKTDPTAPAALCATSDIRSGEEVVVEAGEIVPVDLLITEGEAEILAPVPDSPPVRKRVNDVVCAGCRLLGGQLRGVCTWAGDERALARPLFDAARRADRHAPVARLARLIAERGAVVPLVLAVVYALVRRRPPLDAALVAVGGMAAIASLPLATSASLAIARGLHAALRRGIVYNQALAWDRCARTTAAVFCARGTLLRGEPELTDVERTSDRATLEEVLALGAGALAAERTPIGATLVRAARQRGVAPDATRNGRLVPGYGVTAVASTGEVLCVGNRALLLERGISMAAAEQRIFELESAGRSVILVAKAGRLLGLLALADGLRTGARAAVQHLLDTRIEPVLLATDARQTCEALGRSLDIDHLRAEVPDTERAAEVKRLQEAGAVVAVIGHSPIDDEPLGRADASIALGHAGSAPDEFSASLVLDDVRDAALALALAARTRRAAIQALTLAAVPAAFGALVTAVGLLPPEYAPLAAALGALAASAHLWLFDRGLRG
ncbi:MAG: cation-translocating P-type ATPase [Myxococcales bacterium]|nr:cation-translocating P-type ATPase [Myxococcales bacterium]